MSAVIKFSYYKPIKSHSLKTSKRRMRPCVLCKNEKGKDQNKMKYKKLIEEKKIEYYFLPDSDEMIFTHSNNSKNNYQSKIEKNVVSNMKDYLINILLIFIIIVSNTYFNYLNNNIMKMTDLPITIGFIQFAFSSLLGFFHMRNLTFHHFKCGFFHWLSHVPMNLSIKLSTIGFAHILKCLEPIISLLFIYIFKNSIPSKKKVLAVLILVLGVILSTYNEISFGINALLFCTISMIGNCLRNILSDDRKHISYYSEFVKTSFFSALLSIPFIYFFEYKKLYILSNFYYLSVIISTCILMHLYFTTFYILLKKTNSLTISLTNTGKRVGILVFSKLVNMEQMNNYNLIGALITIVGILIYTF